MNGIAAQAGAAAAGALAGGTMLAAGGVKPTAQNLAPFTPSGSGGSSGGQGGNGGSVVQANQGTAGGGSSGGGGQSSGGGTAVGSLVGVSNWMNNQGGSGASMPPVAPAAASPAPPDHCYCKKQWDKHWGDGDTTIEADCHCKKFGDFHRSNFRWFEDKCIKCGGPWG